MILEVCWDGVRKLFFWALTISRSRALGSCVCVCGGPWKAIVTGLKSHCEVAAQVVVCFQTSSGMILEVCWDGLRTLFFWLSQFHGHSSSLVCVCGGPWEANRHGPSVSCVKWPLKVLCVFNRRLQVVSDSWGGPRVPIEQPLILQRNKCMPGTVWPCSHLYKANFHRLITSFLPHLFMSLGPAAWMNAAKSDLYITSCQVSRLSSILLAIDHFLQHRSIHRCLQPSTKMVFNVIRKNWQLVTYEPVEFGK